MKDLRVDNSFIEDPKALVERLEEKGYLFLRGYLDKKKVLHLRETIIETLKKEKWVDPKSPKGKAVPELPIRTFRSKEYDSALPHIQSLEELHRFAYDERLLTLMQKIIGSPVVAHATRVVRIINPIALEEDSTVDVHQDYRYVQGTPATYTTWIPLGDCPKKMGGLRIIEGSHKAGVRPVLGLGKSKCGIVDVPEDHPDWAAASYQAGDVLVFHSYTIHGPLPNHTSFLRLSVDFRYQSIYEPICERALQPFCYPDIPNWDVLTKHWSTKQWVEVPASMKVVPYDKAVQNG